MNAFEELFFYLEKAGLDETAICVLLARFMEEEAEHFVEIIKKDRS